MSDLNPKGVPITFNGVERHFLFTARVFDQIQDRYKEPVFNVVSRLGDDMENVKTMVELATILVNDEVARETFFNGHTDLKPATEEEMSWLISIDNMGEVTTSILEAYGISSPEPSKEDKEDPNQKTAQLK